MTTTVDAALVARVLRLDADEKRLREIYTPVAGNGCSDEWYAWQNAKTDYANTAINAAPPLATALREAWATLDATRAELRRLEGVRDAAYRVVGAWDNQDGLLAHEMMTHISTPIDELAAALAATASTEQEPRR